MSTETHEGYVNRETWALSLWLNNDEGLYNMARETARIGSPERADERIKSLAESLFTRSGYENEFGSPWPTALADAAEDIGSLWRVDYAEVAEGFLAD